MEAAVLAQALIGVLLRYAGVYGPGTWLAADGMLGGLCGRRRAGGDHVSGVQRRG